RHADQIERRTGRECGCRQQAEAAVARHSSVRLGNYVHCRLRQPCEDLQRPSEIELGQLREDDKADIEDRHFRSPLALNRARNSVGETAMVRVNARSIRRSEPNPQLRAMVSTLSS